MKTPSFIHSFTTKTERERTATRSPSMCETVLHAICSKCSTTHLVYYKHNQMFWSFFLFFWFIQRKKERTNKWKKKNKTKWAKCFIIIIITDCWCSDWSSCWCSYLSPSLALPFSFQRVLIVFFLIQNTWKTQLVQANFFIL